MSYEKNWKPDVGNAGGEQARRVKRATGPFLLSQSRPIAVIILYFSNYDNIISSPHLQRSRQILGGQHQLQSIRITQNTATGLVDISAQVWRRFFSLPPFSTTIQILFTVFSMTAPGPAFHQTQTSVSWESRRHYCGQRGWHDVHNHINANKVARVCHIICLFSLKKPVIKPNAFQSHGYRRKHNSSYNENV